MDGYRDRRAGGRKAKLADPSWGKGSHLPQTAPASDPDDPCPTWTTAGKGKSADFLFFNWRNYLAGVLELSVTWPTGGRAGDCCEHLDSLFVQHPQI